MFQHHNAWSQASMCPYFWAEVSFKGPKGHTRMKWTVTIKETTWLPPVSPAGWDTERKPSPGGSFYQVLADIYQQHFNSAGHAVTDMRWKDCGKYTRTLWNESSIWTPHHSKVAHNAPHRHKWKSVKMPWSQKTENSVLTFTLFMNLSLLSQQVCLQQHFRRCGSVMFGDLNLQCDLDHEDTNPVALHDIPALGEWCIIIPSLVAKGSNI